MNRLRASRTVTTWLAMSAVLLGALLPVFSHAAARANPSSGWLEICTSTGMVWVHAPSGQLAEAVPDTSLASAMAGCTWCLLQGGAGGLPPSHDTPHFGLAGTALQPLPAESPGWVQAHWPSALTRAPPALT